jgi:hypothetical protein
MPADYQMSRKRYLYIKRIRNQKYKKRSAFNKRKLQPAENQLCLFLKIYKKFDGSEG